jgi:hypothetical protein
VFAPFVCLGTICVFAPLVCLHHWCTELVCVYLLDIVMWFNMQHCSLVQELSFVSSYHQHALCTFKLTLICIKVHKKYTICLPCL